MSVPGWSDEALYEAVVVSPRVAFVPADDTEVREAPGWRQLITPSLASGILNEVTRCELPDDVADARIDATIAEYRRLGLRSRWTIAADSRPRDLAARLAARGLVANDAIGMARATTPPIGGVDPAITVEDVDAGSVDEFTRVMAGGWQMDPAPLVAFHRRQLADPARRARMYLARHGGEPAGASALITLPRSIHLLGGVVLEAQRGRGVYRAMVDARLAYAAAHGLTLATTHARATTSAPILAAVGFVEVCRFEIYKDG